MQFCQDTCSDLILDESEETFILEKELCYVIKDPAMIKIILGQVYNQNQEQLLEEGM